jgi:hypothetical protein
MKVEVGTVSSRPFAVLIQINPGAAVKNLKRLFPTDQSMVVIIDDRWEVWSHGPNLVKVVPCTSCLASVSRLLTSIPSRFFRGHGRH